MNNLFILSFIGIIILAYIYYKNNIYKNNTRSKSITNNNDTATDSEINTDDSNIDIDTNTDTD